EFGPRRHRLHAFDCGSASYAAEWERHQNGFWFEGAAGTGKNRGADYATAGGGGAKSGNAAPDPAIARSGGSPAPRDCIALERVELARHPQRPYTLDYVERIFTDWSEIHGDRGFRDDPAIVCGMARFHGEEVVIVGQQKARDAKQRVYRNFGMPHPEGYRKALRVMKIAEKFKRPIFTFVDT